jgi:hypothetical protein
MYPPETSLLELHSDENLEKQLRLAEAYRKNGQEGLRLALAKMYPDKAPEDLKHLIDQKDPTSLSPETRPDSEAPMTPNR